jgi:excisionase family DNA binding protein
MDTIAVSGLERSDALLLSKRRAAQLLGLSVRSIEIMIRAKQLDSRKIGRRRLVPRKEVERLSRHDTPVIGSPPRSGNHADA